MVISAARSSVAVAACALAFFWIGVAHAGHIALDRGPVVLGRTESVGVTLHVDEPPGAQDRPIRVAVNVGHFSEVVRKGPGLYRSVYFPPATKFPQIALIAVWRETGPDAPIEFLRIQLYGVTKIPVTAKPGSDVSIAVGPDEFGPVTTNARGEASVSVTVPPNVHQAVVKAKERSGKVGIEKIPIEVPSYNRLTAALVPHAVLADGQSWARVEVYYDLGGGHVPADQVEARASIGSLALITADRGRYAYRYTAPADAREPGVDFSVTVKTDPAAKATAHLTFGLPPPAKVVVRPPAARLPADGKAHANVEVIILDDAGLGLPHQEISLEANGQSLGAATYVVNGIYRWNYVTPAVYPSGGIVQFAASLNQAKGGPLTALANYQLEAAQVPKSLSASWDPAPVPADGRTQAQLSLDVRDAAGFPLRGARLLIVASHGTAGTPSERQAGIYQVPYVAPSNPPPGDPVVRVVDPSGVFERSVTVPLRDRVPHVLFGARGGFTHSLRDLVGPRAGLELSVPIRVASSYLTLSAVAEAGLASQTIADPSGAFVSRSTARFLPISVRAAYELLATRKMSLAIGAGPTLTLARFSTSLSGASGAGWGLGGTAFVSDSYSLGPGQAFAELAFSYQPVSSTDFQLDAGGIGLVVGYRWGFL